MKTKKIRIRQGFTIVELVIVIGVVGVLSAVLIPTFINLNQKANRASDESLVKNLNTALAMQEQDPKDIKNATMQDAVDDLKEYGYLLPNLVTKSEDKLLWNQKTNRFILESDDKGEYKDVDFWRIQSSIAGGEKYSIYAGLNFEGAGTNKDAVTVSVGFDAGENEGIKTVNYTRTEGAGQEVIIRTNGVGTALVVNAPHDTVHHYDYIDELTITAVADASYHEHGTVRGKAKIAQGHFVVEGGAVVPQVSVENATAAVKVTANEATIVTADTASSSQTSVVANTSEVFVSGLSGDKITGNAVVAEPVNDAEGLQNALAKGYAQLNADVTVDGNLAISKAAVIDLNGRTLTVNGLILNNGNLTIDDSKDNGNKKVSNVVNDATAAKTSADVPTQSSLSYTKTLQGTLKADSIITSSNHNLTVLNGSFVSELDYHKYYETEYEVDGFIYVAKDANAVIYNGAFFSENIEDATEQFAAAAVAVISNRGNTTIYKGEFVTKYCRETYDNYFIDPNKNPHTSIPGLYNKDRMQYSYYSISSYGGSLTISPKTNSDVVVYSARGALSLSAGDAEISGGTFNAYYYYAAYIAGSSGRVKGTITGGEFNLIKGDDNYLAAGTALYIGNDAAGDGGKRQPANVTILDCVVNSDASKAINVANMTGSIVVYGGKYNKAISNDFIDGSEYKIVQEDGYYVVKKK
jgi:prepilin-type N-terminal cleavage/methylation domain-containing protein